MASNSDAVVNFSIEKLCDHDGAACAGAVGDGRTRGEDSRPNPAGGAPAVLIRASLACKAWCRLLSGNAFRSRYRTLHKTPPILGFLQSWEDNVERFVPTTNFCPCNPDRRDYLVHDCRHGRVLLGFQWDEAPEEEKKDEGEEADKEEKKDEGEEADKEEGEEDNDAEQEEEDEDEGEEDDRDLKMVVWDPVSGSRTKLHSRPDIFDPRITRTTYWGSVLCAADGCNHAACNLGPFFVVLICLDIDEPYDDDEIENNNYKRLVWASVYSSETREWTSPASIHIGGLASFVGRPRVLVGQALHFLFQDQGVCILKYDLGTNRLSVIDLRGMGVCSWDSLLISADDSRLGLVNTGMDKLCFMWLVEVSADGLASWIQLREMDLKTLVPIRDPMGLFSLKLVGCVEGTEIIIVVTDLGAFTIDLKSLRLRKLSSKPYNSAFRQDVFENLFLYTSFNSPPAVAGAVAVAGTEISK